MRLKQVFAILISFVLAGNLLFADVARDPNGKPKQDNQIQRAARGVYDLQSNTVSNLEFYTTNYGMFGLNVALNQGSGKWPRGSSNHYIFGGGIWFAAQKNRPGTNEIRNYVEVSYNPNSGTSWMVPGRISDGPLVDNDAAKKYRIYFSTDFFSNDGQAITSDDGPAWPIWDANPDPESVLTHDRYFGYYIPEEGDRKPGTYPKGPAFISGEDIFTTFKDTDLSRYEGGTAQRKAEGYPLQLQYEKMIYSWGFGDYRDIVFLAYNITNYSSDTLWNCWMSPVMDVDIATAFNLSAGAANDHVKFYDEDPSLNLAFQWTDPDRGERGQGFGYLGFTFLESPTVIKHYDTTFIRDGNGNIIGFNLTDRIEANTNFVRKDSAYYALENQLGLVTFRNWSIDYDPKGDDERYNFISAGIREGDTGPGDKRFMMATGPFHLRPMDTVRVVVGIMLGNAAKGNDADGTKEDLPELLLKTKFAIDVYNKNFAAPKPPDRGLFVQTEGMNNSVRVTWDSTSEISRDVLESGMDFMGYRLYRARRTDLDTFDINTVQATGTYPRGKGPLGWKQLEQWEMPTPFRKSVRRSGDIRNVNNPFIDSLRIIGPELNAQGGVIDSMSIRVMRVPQGFNLYSDYEIYTILATDASFRADNFGLSLPIIANVDTSYFAQPWGTYISQFANFAKEVVITTGTPPQITKYPYINFKPDEHLYLFDSIIGGVAKIDRALMKFNPLLYQKKSINIPDTNVVKIPSDGLVYLKIGDQLTQTVDTAYMVDTYRSAIINGRTTYIIDAYVPYPKAQWMTDPLQVRNALDELYNMIQTNKISEITFADFQNSPAAVNDVIVPYMRQITNGRTFYDVGEDNHDGVLTYDEDPAKTEKLINNVPYYYKLLAYDEGDYQQPTPLKLNDGNPGLPNFAALYPAAPRAEKQVNFEVIYVDPTIGGLYNFSVFDLNAERAMQLFAGDTLELEFQPLWSEREMRFLGRPEAQVSNFGLYQRNMVLRNLTKDQVLFSGPTYFEVQPGYFSSLRGLFTENGFSYVLSDTLVYDQISDKIITFGLPNNKEIVQRTGMFTSGNFKEQTYSYTRSMLPPAYGTIGFDFDFSIQQFGGDFRADSVTIAEAKYANGGSTPTSNATTAIGFKSSPTGRDPEVVLTTQKVDNAFFEKSSSTYRSYQVDGSFNNGPGHYLVEFLPGGEEMMTVEYGSASNKVNKTFRVPYLNLRITNQISYYRPAPELGENDSALVSYPGELPFMFIDTVPSYNTLSTNPPFNPNFQYPTRKYPDPRNLPFHGISTNEYIGKYNIAAYGWVNSRRASNLNMPNTVARPFNSALRTEEKTYLAQGRYYLTAVSEDRLDTLDFTHGLDISGVMFGLDYANRGGRWVGVTEWGRITSGYQFGDDFKAGEKIMLKTFGGALGMPMPGAKVRFKASKTMEEGEKYTDKLLDQIQVVPNPYYVTHQGQKSPYDAQLFFTRLPKVCTIDIYTITGDLIVSIEHDEATSSTKDKYALNIWNLLTKNGQRIASQTLAAVISTPDGAQTIKNFSVVVGGFRLLPD